MCDGGVSLSGVERYVFAGNENYVEDVVSGVWNESLDGYNEGAGRIQQLQLFDGYVRIDTVSGTAGTAFPIGTYRTPSNNLTDALSICSMNGVKRLRLRSDLTIESGHDVSNMSIETRGIPGVNVTLEDGCCTDNTTFRYLNLHGVVTNSDVLVVEICSISNLENFTGYMFDVTFTQGSEISINSWAEIYNCRAGGEPGNEPEIDIGNSILNIQQYRGNVKFTNKTGDNRTVMGGLSASLIIASSCVAGTIQLLGIGELEKDESGPGCKVDIDATLTPINISDFVWDEKITEHSVVGSMGLSLQQGLWFLDENSKLDQQVYNVDHRLTSARKIVYTDKTFNQILATYKITAVWSGQELTSYQIVRV